MPWAKKIFFLIFSAVILAGSLSAGFVFAETQTGGISVGVTISGCGDGTIDSGETCDNGGSNGACPATCSASCTVNSCGGGPSTPPTPDTPPTISNVNTTAITASGATVSWSASDNNGISSASFVYGLTTSYGSTGSISGTYSVNLSGLSANTTYFFKISVTDTASQTTDSTGSFTTLSAADSTPPVISNIQIVTGTTAATVNFNTNELATAQINYGLTSAYGATVNGGVAATTHSIVIPGLSPNATYHYRIVADDVALNSASTADAAFITLLPAPPANVGSFTLTPSFAAITLNWNNSGISYFSGVKLLRKSGTTASASGPSDSAATALLNNSSATQYIDSGISPATDYSYTIYVFDIFGQNSSGVSRSGRITNAGLEICGNGIDDDSDSGIDCADSDCATNPLCVAGVENCSNGVDDDSDGAIDCADSNCSGSGLCAPVVYNEVCNNLYDDDSDGQIDCADFDCVGFAGCAVGGSGGGGAASASCADGVDNDGDGKVDYPADPGCESAADNNEADAPTVPGFLQLSVNDINFFAGNRRIVLLSSGGQVNSLAGSNFTVAVAKTRFPAAPESVALAMDGATYQFGYNAADDNYYSDFTLPNVGIHNAYLLVDYGGGQKDNVLIKINCLPAGMVKSGGEPVGQAEVNLFSENGAALNLSEYGQSNPVLTSASGLYGWVVLPGRYQLRVQKDGYYDYEEQIYSVVNNVVNNNVNLVKRPPKLEDVIDPGATLGENVVNVAKNLAEKGAAAGQLAAQAINEAADNPQVEKAATQVVAPTAIGVSAVGTVAVVPWFDLIALLRFLFLQPLLLLGRGKRKQWGVVYNSLNKLPIDLALVRLIDGASGKLVRSRVTDRNGRFTFIVAPGKYRLEVTKMNLTFPSALLAGVASDGKRLDIYHGEEINVTDDNVLITANIPLDPLDVSKPPKRILRERFLRKIQSVVSGLGLAFTLVALYVSPVWYMWVLAVAHFGLIFLFKRLARPRTAKGWGIVYDEATNKPVGRVIARLFDSRFNRLVATEITDKRGRYNFLAGDNKYYVAYEHADYEPNKTEIIDLTGKEEDAIAADAKLKKKGLSTA